ncbi:MAG: DUF4430 domain-containing protein [Verrucomicrobiota bacterium]
MKKLFPFTLALVALITTIACATEQKTDGHGGSANIIALKIDYGTEKPARTIQVPFKKGQTALEILQHAATVETHAVAQHVVVTAIDGVAGSRGKTAWYYTINGKSAKKLAISTIIDKPCHITWIYTKDRCSCTVDG